MAQYKYKPYGADNGSSPGTVPNPFRFAARQLDSETGLYYMRARYYDPQLGRFVSEDPIGLAGGINVYLYAGDNPVNGRDPSGELCHPLPTLRSDPAAASAGQCDGGGGGGGDRGVGGWFGPDDSPDYGDVSGGYWTTADVLDFYNWAKAQPGDHVSGAEWIAAGRPQVVREDGLYISIGGVFRDAHGAFLEYVKRPGTFQVTTYTVDHGVGVRGSEHERTLVGTIDLFTYAGGHFGDVAVYYGTVYVQGYPPITVIGVVLRIDDAGTFYHSAFQPPRP